MKLLFVLWMVLFCEVFCSGTVAEVSSVVVTENVALGKPCNMTSRYSEDGYNNNCEAAINGNPSTEYAAGNCIHTDITDNNPNWNVDLGYHYNITSIVIYARSSNLFRMAGVSVYIDNNMVHEFVTLPTTAMITIPINPAVSGRVVSIARNQALINICEVQVFAQRILMLENVAVNKPCNMSKVYYYEMDEGYDVFNNSCSAANNDDTSTTYAQGNCIRTHWEDRTPHWTVNLEHVYTIYKIAIYPRSGAESEMTDVMVQVGNNPAQPVPSTTNTDPLDIVLSPPQTGSTVTVFRPDPGSSVRTYNYLRFCEVQVWAVIPGYRNLAEGKSCYMSPFYHYETHNEWWYNVDDNTCHAANNGNTSTAYAKGNCIYTHWDDRNPHWTVMLGTGRFQVYDIVIFRADDEQYLTGLMTNVRVLVDGQVVMTFPRFSSQNPQPEISLVTDIQVIPPRVAHNITVIRDDTTPGDLNGYTYMRLCEVQVWGTCSPGFYGDSCDQTCEYNEGCQPHTCSPLDGHCVCRDGWKTPQCTECAPRRYEKSSDCQKLCSAGCTGGICNADGTCSCRPRWQQSPKCDRCDDDHYGQSRDCVLQCTAGPGCVGCLENGTCKACKPHFDNFPGCNQCSRGFYGHNCDSICGQGCEHGTCNRDGTCTCLPNWGPNTPAAFCNVIEGLYWERLGLQESGFLLLCPGENAYLNWTVNAGHRITEILNIEWFYAGNSRELMALLDHDHFIILPAFSRRLHHFGNASIMLSDVLAMDSGNYSVEVIATEVGAVDGTASLYGDVVLRVAEEPVLTSHTLVAVENSQAVLDPRTGQWSIELLCGTFQDLGDPPVHMVWRTPNDTKPIASSSYRDGQFRLLLTHPIQGGQYTCLPNTSKNISFPAEDGCLKSSASVTVDGVADTMILYQAEIHDLKNKPNNCTCP